MEHFHTLFDDDCLNLHKDSISEFFNREEIKTKHDISLLKRYQLEKSGLPTEAKLALVTYLNSRYNKEFNKPKYH